MNESHVAGWMPVYLENAQRNALHFDTRRTAEAATYCTSIQYCTVRRRCVEKSNLSAGVGGSPPKGTDSHRRAESAALTPAMRSPGVLVYSRECASSFGALQHRARWIFLPSSDCERVSARSGSADAGRSAKQARRVTPSTATVGIVTWGGRKCGRSAKSKREGREGAGERRREANEGRETLGDREGGPREVAAGRHPLCRRFWNLPFWFFIIAILAEIVFYNTSNS